ncbi:Alpha/Beta hydrolase protein [Lentinula raphanica]|uniref:Alpha/Beta hydrolase protein n=1 Tax=Lentinula raphanica TaxID=153919 RepID=A0AA38U835_9AGAR|nr:Alpha/Beta hydrolase protein [Lentinula raphanica]KAJ3833911.1 Alpha/Beta hydrolase protein [Lentinula raphanica]KAJ3972737.1 Alpha/Beta hydrolase protein [Lentinula raphanica]
MGQSKRWALKAQAVMWRNLMDIGMHLHMLAPPPAPSPSFLKSIPSTLASKPGYIPLHFYVPESYNSINPAQPKRLYPVVINFHGGGFTIGRATDDARWARAVVHYADAVVVSVDYRLAPEHPFPIAIEDGVDATLYLVEHADELRIDPHRIAYSGFSAGGNMSFSVPIRLAEEYRLRRLQRETSQSGSSSGTASTQEGTVIAISSWYPSIDYTNTRAERRKTNVRSDKELPKFFTNLFDASYLYPVNGVDLKSPWLSPGIAPSDMIKDLPENIVLYTCEWDELCAEADRFHTRLVDDFGKKVVYKKVMGVAHAFDKTPNPLHWDPKIETMYRDACRELRTVFYGSSADSAIEQAVVEGKQGQQASVTTRIEDVRFPSSQDSLATVGSTYQQPVAGNPN